MSVKNELNHLKLADIAALFDVNIRTIQRWVDEGLPRHGEGIGHYYVWSEVRAWWEGRLSPSAEAKDKDRKLAAEADLAEMERDREAGKLMRTDEALRAWGGFLRGLQSNLMGYPDRVAPDIGDGMTLAERREVLRRAMIASLQGAVAEAQKAAEEPAA